VGTAEEGEDVPLGRRAVHAPPARPVEREHPACRVPPWGTPALRGLRVFDLPVILETGLRSEGGSLVPAVGRRARGGLPLGEVLKAIVAPGVILHQSGQV
jgi:hypothetical protein